MAIILPNERVFIGGKTGCGKTYLAQKLLEPFPYVVVLDNKGMFNWKGAALVTDIMKLPQAADKFNRIVYRPPAELESDRGLFMDTMDSFFWWIYNRENCIIYVDEATAVTDSHNILPGHNAVLKRGREKGIGNWNSSQQPVNVHNTLMSEAEHYFVFRMQLQSHRDKLAGFMGDSVRTTIPPKYHFYYFNPESMDNAEMMNPI